VASRDLIHDAVTVDEAKVDTREGAVILRGVSVASILRFLRNYAFHEESFDLDSTVVTRYIERQNEKGRLGTWNVALMGGPPDSPEGLFDFSLGFSVKRIRRSKLREGPVDFADIKTLMSKEDRVVDLPHLDQTTARRMTERQLTDERSGDSPGLLALYPIDRTSPPDESNIATRVPLNALDDVIGVGLVFPGTGDEEAVEYLSADLSRLGLTPDEVEVSEDEDPDAEESGATQEASAN
jgi:hypothetical protein